MTTTSAIPASITPDPEEIIEKRHSLVPVLDSLPGDSVPYALAAGEGNQLQLGPYHVTVMSRPEDNGGVFSLARVSSGTVPATPFFSVPGPTFVHVMEGRLTLWFMDGRREVIAGGSATIPADTPWSFASEGLINSALVYSSSDALLRAARRLGSSSSSHTFRVSDGITGIAHEEPEACGFTFYKRDYLAELGPRFARLPQEMRAFSLEDGEGDRLEQFEQINSFVCRPRHTDNQFLAVQTRGAKAPYIPRHFHRLHTENFICLDGHVTLNVNERELVLSRGDYVHAPAGTIHSFAFTGHNTQMLGVLTTGVFEKFFDYMNTPTDARVQLENGGEPEFPAEAFVKVQAELDVEVVGPPPEG
ncbi:cupin domain-containing protein [Rothia uropygioeca]|uniref:cupin domain-containing protein n=1 Tax=Kocuria sp. 257 TaxID=2021970 RepID=UPI0010130C47|nr:cupin domain-containing protein [Kocuria sp. 257]